MTLITFFQGIATLLTSTLGIAAPSYGFDGGETSDPLPGLLTS